ncbi:MAG: hypothetical protein ACOCZ5_02385 [bacterium]
MKKSNVKIVVAAALIAIVLCLILFNYYVSINVKESFSTAIEDIHLKEDDFKITYDKISSAPILSIVTIHNMVFVDTENNISFIIEELKIKLPYSKTFNIPSDLKENAYPLNIIAQNPILVSEYGDISFDNIKLEYDGRFDPERVEETLFSTNQYLKFVITDADLLLKEKFFTEADIDPAMNDFIPTLDNFSIAVSYDAKNNQIDIQEYKIDTDYFNCDMTYNITYNKDNPDDTKVIISGESEANLTTNGKEFGNLDEFGVISLEALNTTSSAHSTFLLGDNFPQSDNLYEVFKNLVEQEKYLDNYYSQDNIIDSNDFPYEFNNEFTMNLTNLSLEIGQKLNDPQNPILITSNMKNITINNLDIDVNNDIKSMDINANLKSSLIDIDLTVDMESSKLLYDEYTNINKGKVVISNMSPELEMIVYFIEMENGQSFPREDGNIVFEIEGNINNPEIKGYDIY